MDIGLARAFKSTSLFFRLLLSLRRYLEQYDMSGVRNDMNLSAPSTNLSATHTYEEGIKQFILFWGDMASSWGINRTMAQIHALLYAIDEPLDTDEIMRRLQISRGNANMNLRALVDWRLAQRVQQLGSRKDYYTSEKDVWKISTTVIQERNRREVLPVRQTLLECLRLLQQVPTAPSASAPVTRQAQQFAHRIQNLIDMIGVFESFTEALLPFLTESNLVMIQQLITLADAVKSRAEEDDAGMEKR
jgi:DNA-binding transcriptional regulator GbsR (MarR family)